MQCISQMETLPPEPNNTFLTPAGVMKTSLTNAAGIQSVLAEIVM